MTTSRTPATETAARAAGALRPRRAPTPSATTVVVVLLATAFFAGLTIGALVGYGARRPARVQCTSTLRIEPAGPGEWTLVCEGGR